MLKKVYRAKVYVQPTLPLVFEVEKTLLAASQALLERRVCKKRDEVLIHWQGLTLAKATWKDVTQMKARFPDLNLEDKFHLRGMVSQVAPNCDSILPTPNIGRDLSMSRGRQRDE